MGATLRPADPGSDYLRIQLLGFVFSLLSPALIAAGFWLLLFTPRPCNIDFGSGTPATAAGATILILGVVLLVVGTRLLAVRARPPVTPS